MQTQIQTQKQIQIWRHKKISATANCIVHILTWGWIQPQPQIYLICTLHLMKKEGWKIWIFLGDNWQKFYPIRENTYLKNHVFQSWKQVRKKIWQSKKKVGKMSIWIHLYRRKNTKFQRGLSNVRGLSQRLGHCCSAPLNCSIHQSQAAVTRLFFFVFSRVVKKAQPMQRDLQCSWIDLVGLPFL